VREPLLLARAASPAGSSTTPPPLVRTDPGRAAEGDHRHGAPMRAAVICSASGPPDAHRVRTLHRPAVQLDASPTPPEHRLLFEDESSEVAAHPRASRKRPPRPRLVDTSSARVARDDPGHVVA
jgi:hypothetical protein